MQDVSRGAIHLYTAQYRVVDMTVNDKPFSKVEHRLSHHRGHDRRCKLENKGSSIWSEASHVEDRVVPMWIRTTEFVPQLLVCRDKLGDRLLVSSVKGDGRRGGVRLNELVGGSHYKSRHCNCGSNVVLKQVNIYEKVVDVYHFSDICTSLLLIHTFT